MAAAAAAEADPDPAHSPAAAASAGAAAASSAAGAGKASNSDSTLHVPGLHGPEPPCGVPTEQHSGAFAKAGLSHMLRRVTNMV